MSYTRPQVPTATCTPVRRICASSFQGEPPTSSATRTPIGRSGRGYFRNTRPDELLVPVLQAALQAGFLWLVVFAVLMAVIGAFYYLRIVKLMYFDEPTDHTPINNPPEMNMLLSVNALGLLALGIMPQRLMDICAYAIAHSLQ